MGKVITIVFLFVVAGFVGYFLSITPTSGILGITGQVIGEDYYSNEFSQFDEASPTDRFSKSIDVHWDHMPLAYNWNQECDEWHEGKYPERIKMALDEISNVTDNIITFKQIDSGEPDIMFICNKSLYYEKDEIIAEAGSYFYKETNTYAPSAVYIYNPNSCKDRPTTLIHEVLHLFGVPHTSSTYYAYDSNNRMDIMYPEKYNCNAYIPSYTIDYLKKTYTNQGGYFDWNLQIWFDYNPYEFPSLDSCMERSVDNLDKYNCVLNFAKNNPSDCEGGFNVVTEKYWVGKCYSEVAISTNNSNLCTTVEIYDQSQNVLGSPRWECKIHFGLLSECEGKCSEEKINYNFMKCLSECI